MNKTFLEFSRACGRWLPVQMREHFGELVSLYLNEHCQLPTFKKTRHVTQGFKIDSIGKGSVCDIKNYLSRFRATNCRAHVNLIIFGQNRTCETCYAKT